MADTAPPAARRSWPRRLLNRMEVDRATFYAVAARAWQFLASPVSMVLIVLYFTPEVQGFYYTFASLLALQILVELGLPVVIINIAGHEWANLQWDLRKGVVGDDAARSRLASLARTALLWYIAASAVFVLAVGAAGIAFFGQEQAGNIAWRAPWLSLVILGGCSLALAPLVAILEGCGQVIEVNRNRLLQAVFANLAVWLLIPLGGNLWASVGAMAAKVLWEWQLVGLQFASFFRPLLRRPRGPMISWRREVWPLQWRAAAQSVLAYGAWQFITPIMFHYHGAGVAGRMGLTWTAVIAVQAAAAAWLDTRKWLLARLVAQGERQELDRVYSRLTWVSGIALAVGGLGLSGFVWAVNRIDHPWMDLIARRILPPLPTALFVLAAMLFHLPRCQTCYIQAHKQDPFVVPTAIVNGALVLAMWLLGARYGPTGAALAYVAVRGLIHVPLWLWIWRRFRQER